MAITDFSTLSDDAATYIRDELLDIAEKNVVFAQHALMASLPQHNSKTCQFSRYPRLDLPLSPVATEGTTPSDQSALAVETVQAVVDQWILIVGLTDIAQLTVKHPLIPIVSDLLGLAQAELVDREIQKALMADAGVTFANTTSRAGLAGGSTTNYITPTVLGDLWATLRRNGARQIGMNYILIVDPEVSQDILAGSNSTTFVSVHSFQNVKAIYNNQIGSFMGFDVEVSNFIPTISAGAATAWTLTTASGSFTGYTDGTTVRTVWAVIEGVNPSTGLVEVVYAANEHDITATSQKVVVTTPTSTTYVYNIYVSALDDSSAVSALHLVTAYAAAAATVNITSVDPTADNPQAAVETTAVVHTSYVIGKEAYGMVKLSGDNLRVLMTDGKPSDSDPAAQRRKISLKGSFKALVLNSDWVIRVESLSAF